MTSSVEVPDTQAFAASRRRMVETQVAARGVREPRVLAAMAKVPRHQFVPPGLVEQAYEDHPVQIGEGQTISQPYMVGFMTQALELLPGDRVLEIGTGSAYQTAILAELATEVVSVERSPTLADTARARLKRLGYANVTVITGDGTLGYPPQSPYDAILVTAAGPRMPPALKDQLKRGGRLLCPVGPRELQSLIKVARLEEGFEERETIHCVFVPLIGEHGWDSA